MVLSGNSTQTNYSRSNAVVSLSGKEQISPVLLLPDNAPDNHNDIEMASVIRTSLRTRKKSSSGEKSISPIPVTNDTSSPYYSLVDFLSKRTCDTLALNKNEISSLWSCGQCCQTFLSSSELQVHLTSHNTKSVPVINNHTTNKKKRQSPDEPVARKRIKRSASPDPSFVFNADNMQHISNNGEQFYRCDICNQLFAASDSEGLKIHYLRSHINYQFISSGDRALCSIVDDGLKSKVTDFLYRCYFCNVSCADKQVLIDHHSEHKSNIFRCDHCHSVFYQNKAFNNHMKNCSKNSTSVLCRHCKEPTYVEDTDTHTREYHCYSNGCIRVECMYGCEKKIKKLCELYKHYATVHRDVYFTCLLCKIRFIHAEELTCHNKIVHNIDPTTTNNKTKQNNNTFSESKKQSIFLSTKSDKIKMVSKKSKLSKQSCDVNNLHQKPSDANLPHSHNLNLSSEQQHFQDILFKSILKIDLVEQVNVLKKHAVQYPDMLQLPTDPVFISTPVDTSNSTPALGDEELMRPVFSSSQENHVYICKACGLQCTTLIDINLHMRSAHPYIHNEYYVFNRQDLPKDFWNLVKVKINNSGRSTTGRSNTAVRSNSKSTSQYKCSCCGFEYKERAEFHKHLLQCAKKQKYKPQVLTKSKAAIIKKEDIRIDNTRRPMVITGVLRQVPDDILYSYKKKLEKTIRKPGDSETVFNMLNKLPSKRLVKTTERYDSLFYKNNKAMKPKRSSMERMVQVLNEKNEGFSLSEYLKYFSYHSIPDDDQQEINETLDQPSNDINKVLVDKKIKVNKNNSNEELDKIFSEKKIKMTKPSQAQTKDTKVIVEKKIKSPKLNSLEESSSKHLFDSKKLKVLKVEEKKYKPQKLNGAPAIHYNKINSISSLNNKLNSKETLTTVDIKKESSDAMTEVSISNDMSCNNLHNIKVVPILYPTMNNIKSAPLAHINTKCKTLKVNNKANKNILVEKKGKNLNSGAKKKGKVKLIAAKTKITKVKLNGQVKPSKSKCKLNGNSQNVVLSQQELTPRKKKTIVIISDNPIRLTTMKKDKKK